MWRPIGLPSSSAVRRPPGRLRGRRTGGGDAGEAGAAAAAGSMRSRAKSRTRSRKRASGSSASTRPSFSAWRPETVLPVRIRSSAAAMPISRGSRVEPPQAGTIPRRTSGSPMRVSARSLATRQVEASAISVPPPSATPRMAATVGKGSSAQAPNSRCQTREPASASTGSVTRAISSTSAPAMKLPGLPDSSTRQPMSRRAPSSSSTRSSSASAGRPKTLTFLSGRSKVSVARRSAPTSKRKMEATCTLPSGTALRRFRLGVDAVDDLAVLLVDHAALDLLGRRQLAGLQGPLARQQVPGHDLLEAGQVGVDLGDLGRVEVPHPGVAEQLADLADVAGVHAVLGRPGLEVIELRHQQRRQELAAIADDHRLGDERAALELVLERRRRDVLAVGVDDQLLLAVGDAQEALAVHLADVAGVEPPLGVDRLGGLLRQV